MKKRATSVSARKYVKARRLVFLCTLLAVSGPSIAVAQICMNDAELRAYLAEVAIASMRESFSTCIENHPGQLRREADFSRRMEAIFVKASQESYGAAFRIFTRAFDTEEKARVVMQMVIKRATLPTISKIKQFSASQCSAMFSSYSSMEDTFDESLNAQIDLYFFIERDVIPKCAQAPRQ
jgi:hypothetical protein